MRRLIVGGNWKCNGSVKFCKEFPETVLNKLNFDGKKVQVIVAPAQAHLAIVNGSLKHKDVMMCAQNIS